MQRLSKHVLQEARQGNVKPLMYMATAGPGMGTVALGAKDIIQARGGDDEESTQTGAVGAAALQGAAPVQARRRRQPALERIGVGDE